MISIKPAFAHLSKDEMNQLLDLPVWIALYAAYHADGEISESERADAIKLSYMRTYTAPKSLRELYRLVHLRFAKRFDQLNRRLPLHTADKLIYIRAQLKSALGILSKLDSDVAQSVRQSLDSFYRHVFRADTSFVQYFSLPVVSGHMEKKAASYKPSVG
jgi:hypothetical protein